MRIRPAVAADARGIAEVHVRAWRKAYRAVLSEAFLAGLSVADRERRWQGLLGEEATLTLVAGEPGVVLGFCTPLARSRDDDAPPRTGEIGALYVDPAHWRRGTGGALLAGGLEVLREAGCDAATLWVYESNAAARAFYLAAGFTPDGARRRHRDEGPSEIRLRRTLDRA